MPVFDDYGNPWHVSGGDPGAKAVNALRRQNYELIVLPYEVLAQGLPCPAPEALINPERIEDIVNRTRLKDCAEVLRG